MGIDVTRPSYQDACSFIEYLSAYIDAPSTIKNKVSQVRTYLNLSEADVTGFLHPRVTRALDALERDKSHVPRIKEPLSADILSRVIINLPRDQMGTIVRLAVLILYYGAMRQSELLPRSIRFWSPAVQPTRGDCQLTNNSLSILIKTGKNLYKVGQSRKINLLKSSEVIFCPVHTMAQVLEITPTRSLTDPILMFPRHSTAGACCCHFKRITFHHEANWSPGSDTSDFTSQFAQGCSHKHFFCGAASVA